MGKLARWGKTLGIVLCLAMAAGSVALAFVGADRAGEFMRSAPLTAAATILALALLGSGIIAATRRRWDLLLMHWGCVVILFGAHWGSEVRLRAHDEAKTAYLPLVDGDTNDALWDASLTNRIGVLPFRVHLRRFTVDYYPPAPGARGERQMPAVREYRSAVTILRDGRDPLDADILVNHPLRIEGYQLYQASYGQGRMGDEVVTYTVLMAVQDPGLPCVYNGFILVWLGTLLYAIRAFRHTGGTVP